MRNRTKKQENYFNNYFVNNNFKYGIRCLELINQYHNGVRRDGTEERSHLFEVLGFAISNFENRLNKEELEHLIIVASLHDLVEDYYDEIKFKHLKEEFPLESIRSIKKVTKWKTFSKSKRDYDKYHGKISKDSYSIIIKAIDRLHNLNSCSRVFTIKRKEEYIKETLDYIIPNLKILRKENKNLYTPITYLIYNLKNQINQLNYIIELEKKLKDK